MMTEELFCVCLFVLVLVVRSGDAKGLYSGVPCHMYFDCSGHLRIGENVNINSKMIAMEYVEEEAMCQSLCSDMEGCVVYNWWTENATYPKGPYTCEMFSRCLPYHHVENPSHSPVYAGPPQCGNPVVLFGGEVWNEYFEPRAVETVWPGYNMDGTSLLGDFYLIPEYSTIGSFDSIPIDQEAWMNVDGTGNVARYDSISGVQLNENLILACGGGFYSRRAVELTGPPGEYGPDYSNKCLGLDLVTGTWKSMGSMNHRRMVTLLKVGDQILAVGDRKNDTNNIESYNEDLDQWTPEPQWNAESYNGDAGCAITLDDHQFMMISISEGYHYNARIFDLTSGLWRDVAIPEEIKNVYGGFSCLLTTIDNIEGVLLTGGVFESTGDTFYETSNQTLFYQLKTDSWTKMEPLKYHSAFHQMVMLGDKPTVLGGWFYSKSEEDFDQYDPITRNYIQNFDLGTKVWEKGYNMYYRRSKFAAVSVTLN